MIATTLLSAQPPTSEIVRLLVPNQIVFLNRSISEFVTPRLINLFKSFCFLRDLLTDFVETWKKREYFKEALYTVRALRVNDVAERTVRL